MTLDVLNGEARVDGDTAIGGVPGTGAEIFVDFRDQGGEFTGRTFPTGNLVDTVTMSDGSTVDVTVMDMVNICGFFRADQFGLGCTGLELPAPDGSIRQPPGMLKRLTELRLRIAQLIGWNQYTIDTIGKATLPFAVSVAAPTTYTDLDGIAVKASDIDLVARFYLESIMHSAAPGSGSTCLAAASAIRRNRTERRSARRWMQVRQRRRLHPRPPQRKIQAARRAGHRLGAERSDLPVSELSAHRTDHLRRHRLHQEQSAAGAKGLRSKPTKSRPHRSSSEATTLPFRSSALGCRLGRPQPQRQAAPALPIVTCGASPTICRNSARHPGRGPPRCARSDARLTSFASDLAMGARSA